MPTKLPSVQASQEKFSVISFGLTTFLVLLVSIAMFLGPFGIFLPWLIDESGPITLWDVLAVSAFRFIIAAITCHFATSSNPRFWIFWATFYSSPHFLWYIWYVYNFEGTQLEVARFILLIPFLTIVGCIFGSKRALLYPRYRNRK